MKIFQILIGISFIALGVSAAAETSVEVKLIAAMEEDRGWCLDLRGRLDNAQPVGGLHGHTCDSYSGFGIGADQGYSQEDIFEKDQFRLVVFDKCLTLYEPKPGSFVSLETCDGRAAQQIALNDSGQIVPTYMPQLCLTMDPVVQPDGRGTPLHIMRDVTFELCDDESSERQLWELRAEWTGPQETTAERTFQANPNAAPPPNGGRGMGMGMGAMGMGEQP